MYLEIAIEDRVRVPPKLFSMKLPDAITQILREKYERICDRDLGIVLCIRNAQAISDGNIIHGDGAAYYDVRFNALTYLPQINEVCEAQVAELVEFGAFLGLGPIEGLVHLSQIANDFLNYNKKTPAFVGKESKKILKKEDLVLAKISTVSMKGTISDTKIGLTMRPEGLGKEEWVAATEKKSKSAPKEEAKEEKGKEEKKEKKAKKRKEE
ncbi:DNA-directed RNA polymerase [Candidatus Micrarchaeota archaeon CG11_big_fil_rev_8_21_14_0_20_47_5]|nr:MAG: DNA-directed RNA polymerase [Candidatus Micrarchaeota archaeon CG1_02_47_40]PIN83284.1 MAG: DNA-directed RNA polymerase [Candidatus Micrarchaeota archaeon CG11_big_fil_rev_8_21_14_0_20_47_5]